MTPKFEPIAAFDTQEQALDALGDFVAAGLVTEDRVYHTGIKHLIGFGWCIVLKVRP